MRRVDDHQGSKLLLFGHRHRRQRSAEPRDGRSFLLQELHEEIVPLGVERLQRRAVLRATSEKDHHRDREQRCGEGPRHDRARPRRHFRDSVGGHALSPEVHAVYLADDRAQIGLRLRLHAAPDVLAVRPVTRDPDGPAVVERPKRRREVEPRRAIQVTASRVLFRLTKEELRVGHGLERLGRGVRLHERRPRRRFLRRLSVSLCAKDRVHDEPEDHPDDPRDERPDEDVRDHREDRPERAEAPHRRLFGLCERVLVARGDETFAPLHVARDRAEVSCAKGQRLPRPFAEPVRPVGSRLRDDRVRGRGVERLRRPRRAAREAGRERDPDRHSDRRAPHAARPGRSDARSPSAPSFFARATIAANRVCTSHPSVRVRALM